MWLLTERHPEEDGQRGAYQRPLHQRQDAAGARRARHDRHGRHGRAGRLPGRRRQRPAGNQRRHPRRRREGHGPAGGMLLWRVYDLFIVNHLCLITQHVRVVHVHVHLILGLFQLLSIIYPGAFQSEDIYTKLISFVKNDNDVVCKYM